MKMKSAALAMAAVCIAGSLLPMAAAADTTYDPCDVNRDGTVSVIDTVTISQYLLGVFYVDDPSVMDANQNLIVDVADSQCIQAKIVGLSYTCSFTSAS